MNLISLTSEAQLTDIVNDSTTVVLFKNSTRCSISNMAWKMFQQEWKNSETPVYCLDLLNYRSVSSAIALQFEIEHQSPQVLVIKNGSCVYHATHQAIDAAIVQAAL